MIELTSDELCVVEVYDSGTAVMCSVPGINDSYGSLDVSREPGGRRLMRLLDWPAAIPDVGAQYCDDGGLVTGRILHKPLERVDTAEPDIDRPGPKICDSGIVTVGDLPPAR